MRISDWSSDVCSSDLDVAHRLDLLPRPDRLRNGLVERHVAMRRHDRARHQRRCSAHAARAEAANDQVPPRDHAPRAYPDSRILSGDSSRSSRNTESSVTTKSSIPVLVCRKPRSEAHTSELQSLMRISYAVVCLKKNKQK